MSTEDSKSGRQKPLERFWLYATKQPGDRCWPWRGGLQGRGYGAFSVEGRQWAAHRYSYVMHKGPITDGLYVCHTCDNAACVNPDHLYLGTAKDNAQDRERRGRRDITGPKNPKYKHGKYVGRKPRV